MGGLGMGGPDMGGLILYGACNGGPGIVRNVPNPAQTVRILAYSSTRGSQTKGLERGWKQRARLGRDAKNTPYGRVRLAPFARVRLSRHALPKKTNCFAVYEVTGLSEEWGLTTGTPHSRVRIFVAMLRHRNVIRVFMGILAIVI